MHPLHPCSKQIFFPAFGLTPAYFFGLLCGPSQKTQPLYYNPSMRAGKDGVYAISDDFDIPSEGTSEFVFANGWLLEIVEVESGDYWFYSDGEPVRPTGKRFGVFYPPFTFVRAFARKVRGRTLGVGSETLPSGLATSPFIFETEYEGELTSIDDVREVLDASLNRRSIEVNTRPIARL